VGLGLASNPLNPAGLRWGEANSDHGLSRENGAVRTRRARPFVSASCTNAYTSMTDSAGRAQFSVSGARRTYTLTVTGVSKSGYTFDAAGSVLSKSITK